MATYRLTREIPIEEGNDIVVAGGGPAGASAAICAGRLGAKVLLVEQTGCMGGMGTSGLVCAWDPMANGERMLVGGLMREIVETMYVRGMLQPGIDPNCWRKFDHRWTPFNPEGAKLLFDELATAAGVEVRFFTRVIDADVTGRRVNGVVLQNVEGYRFVKARAFIDCTGDAVLTNLCGAPCREAGRDTPRIMPSTLASLFAGVDWSKPALHTQSPEGVELIEKEYAAGNFEVLDRHLVGISKIGQTIGYLNGGHVFGLNSLKVGDLTNGMMLGRRIVQDCHRFLKKYSANCANMELVATGALMGVRESRRIVGEYELTFEDYLARRQFPDQIGVFNKFVDIHPYDTCKAEYARFREQQQHSGRLKPGEFFGIPYSILVPKGWENLWVAGRCNSSDVNVHGSIRVMPAAAMMGQAAGTAAVQAIRRNQNAYALNTKQLVESLRAAGAYLPQEQLSDEMTRG